MLGGALGAGRRTLHSRPETGTGAERSCAGGRDARAGRARIPAAHRDERRMAAAARERRGPEAKYAERARTTPDSAAGPTDVRWRCAR
ncbi:hypothetical protein A8H35_00845 [Burkholderia thailandensis]|nr:hypothetical protein A8H31_22300 [Burkholderia thailandensis]AWY57208.1 hypothetical protein A8H35_00845 [Burkholderia thailandensis]NOK53540.1 hypothetical protein [Burkholderia thailandensis]